MLKDERIAFIGSGMMGEAIIRGVLAKKLVSPAQIIAADPRAARGAELQKNCGIQTTTDNHLALQNASVVVLAVKPQALAPVYHALQGHIPGAALLLSIVAGARLAELGQSLMHANIVRAMPNTPAQIGEGMTVWTASHETSATQREHARAMLGALGEELYVEDENYLDMATALSGSGPAYVFLFMEAWIDAGVHLGFPRDMAEKLVLQTLKGSVEYARQNSEHLARLRNQVTSPGGTTAEALYYLEKAGFRAALSRALWAAYQRAVQLGRGKKREPHPKD